MSRPLSPTELWAPPRWGSIDCQEVTTCAEAHEVAADVSVLPAPPQPEWYAAPPMQPRMPTRFARLGALALAIAPAISSLGACVENAQPQPYATATAYQAPASQTMQEPRSLGLWKSSFGAVKIEEDLKTGTPGGGVLHGVWMYQRNGADVIGYFTGQLKGNVLQFTWQEPAAAPAAPLEGSGYVVFDQAGQRFAGRWWTTGKDRVGEWNGWRQGMDKPQPPQNPYSTQPTTYGQPYGGQGYGDPNQANQAPPPPPPPSYPNSY